MFHYQKVVFREDHAELMGAILPDPKDNQVVIQARCSLISPGTERAALTGVWDDDWFRMHPGYALAGDVIEMGHNPAGLKHGDRVISLINHGSLALASADPWVTLKIPDELDYAQATFVVLGSVALHAVRRATLQLGESFVIIGMGIIGQIALQLAKMSGASPVIALDIADDRLNLARTYGADITINPQQEDALAALQRATGGRGAQVILEAAGRTETLPLAFKLAAPGGRVVTVGILENEVPMNFHQDFTRRELSLISAYQPLCPTTENLYWRWPQQANRALLIELLASGRLRVDEMLTHRFPAHLTPQVYEHIKNNDPAMLGVLLDWIEPIL